jgi:hypothetical protein
MERLRERKNGKGVLCDDCARARSARKGLTMCYELLIVAGVSYVRPFELPLRLRHASW